MIKVRNKVLMIPENELTIAAVGDKGSVNRVFQIPRIQPDGVDLANMIFKLNLLYLDTNEKDRDGLDKVISDDFITLTWTISSLTSSHVGNAYIQLCAMTDTGSMRWLSYQAAVYIESSIEAEKTTIALSELENLEKRIDEKANALDSAESSRVEAEAERVTAENKRAAAEEARALAEEEREKAENARTDTFTANEAARQKTFEAAEEKRESAFDASEAARQKTFEAAEEKRESAFDASEAAREATFQATEEERQAGYDAHIADFDKDRQELKDYATLSESWAIGGTGSRAGEDEDNSKYYSERSAEEAAAAKNSAENAAKYAQITAPDFYLDIDTGRLYMKGGIGVDFKLENGKLYWKVS